jgi:hypothetical protein
VNPVVWGCKAVVGNRKIFCFGRMLDWGGTDLRLEFPSLFSISSDTKVVVRDYWEEDGCNIK